MENQLFASLAPSFDSANGTQTSNHSKILLFCELTCHQKHRFNRIFYNLYLTSSKLNVTSSKSDVTSFKLNVTSSKSDVTSFKLDVTSSKLNVTSSKLNPTSSRLNSTCFNFNPVNTILNFNQNPWNCFCSFIYLFKHESNWIIQK